MLLDCLRPLCQSCAEELGVLYGQVSIDVELGGGSVAADPDSDEISHGTVRDTVVSNFTTREVRRLSAYLGLFPRSRRVTMASDIAALWAVQCKRRFDCWQRQELMSEKGKLTNREVKAWKGGSKLATLLQQRCRRACESAEKVREATEVGSHAKNELQVTVSDSRIVSPS